MSDLFSKEWMLKFQDEWNDEPELYSELSQAKFNSNIGYGFIDESEPRGVINVEKGKVISADLYAGEVLQWDLRAAVEDWCDWFANPPGMLALGMAYTSQKLKFNQGDYASMIKNPSIAGPFIKSFKVMARVSV